MAAGDIPSRGGIEMPSPLLYTAVKRFAPGVTEDWDRFIAWSGLTQLSEVISRDNWLCPTVFRELTAEDWKHNVQEDFKLDLFYDLDHVLKAADDERVRVLALMENPTAEDVAAFADPRFVFRGYDILDVHGDVSALTNCGGFDKAFSKTELSEHGLITDHRRAFDIRRALREHYPEEHHAVCNVWAIWQMQK
jgi:hypothetical protein